MPLIQCVPLTFRTHSRINNKRQRAERIAKEGRKEASYWQKRFQAHEDRAASAIARYW